jgi:hypothetical protein
MWIRDKQYINAIWITASIEVVPLSDCSHGKSHFGDIEKEFEPGNFSKSGKSTTVYKRLLLQKTQLRVPVSGHALSLCVSYLTHTLIGYTLMRRNPMYLGMDITFVISELFYYYYAVQKA